MDIKTGALEAFRLRSKQDAVSGTLNLIRAMPA